MHSRRPHTCLGDAIAQEVEYLLMADAYRHAAARLRAEIEAMPAPSAVVSLLEELVYGEWPLAADGAVPLGTT